MPNVVLILECALADAKDERLGNLLLMFDGTDGRQSIGYGDPAVLIGFCQIMLLSLQQHHTVKDKGGGI